MRRIERWAGVLAGDLRATVALEFAIVAMAFMMLTMGIFQVGFCLYAKVVLDNAAASITRQLQTGAAKNTAAAGMQSFVSTTVCGALQGLLDCKLVTVTLHPVADYLNPVGNSPPFDPGVSKSLMLLQVTYSSPLPAWPLQVASDTTPMLFTAAVPFVNEY